MRREGGGGGGGGGRGWRTASLPSNLPARAPLGGPPAPLRHQRREHRDLAPKPRRWRLRALRSAGGHSRGGSVQRVRLYAGNLVSPARRCASVLPAVAAARARAHGASSRPPRMWCARRICPAPRLERPALTHASATATATAAAATVPVALRSRAVPVFKVQCRGKTFKSQVGRRGPRAAAVPRASHHAPALLAAA